jgi:Nucleotidyl transferase AbiEii toxin, Type IV TA system
MQSSAFWKAVLVDRENLLEQFLGFMRNSGARYCLIGGTGINAYAYPVVTQDLDIVVAADQIETLEASLARRFTVRRFPHSINVSAPGSKLQVQIQTDERYFEFVDRATIREVMDFELPVARIEDLLQGKIWAALDSTRRPSKQLKDLSDIARIIEVAPALRIRVPPEILAKIPTQLE